jgi:hypothetical protein
MPSLIPIGWAVLQNITIWTKCLQSYKLSFLTMTDGWQDTKYYYKITMTDGWQIPSITKRLQWQMDDRYHVLLKDYNDRYHVLLKDYNDRCMTDTKYY